MTQINNIPLELDKSDNHFYTIADAEHAGKDEATLHLVNQL